MSHKRENKTNNKRLNSEFKTCFAFYEKAIEGRNLHYQNYNTWTNYYAVFTGAIFVGFYNIDKEEIWLSLLIVIIGLITSICWHLTVKGHYHWLLSWIKVIQEYEEELSKIASNNKTKSWGVYSVYFSQQEDSFQKNVSTQKLTSRFTLLIVIAWSIILVSSIYKVISHITNKFGINEFLIMIISIILVLITYRLLNSFFSKKSNIYGMQNSICKRQE